MRILADEDVEYPIIEHLRDQGHTVEAIAEQSPGAMDLPILERAVRDQVLLLTADLDFGGYIYRDRLPAPSVGVVLYRLDDTLLSDEKAEIVARVFAQRNEQEFARNFTVIESDQVRIRPLPYIEYGESGRGKG